MSTDQSTAYTCLACGWLVTELNVDLKGKPFNCEPTCGFTGRVIVAGALQRVRFKAPDGACEEAHTIKDAADAPVGTSDADERFLE